MKWTNGSRKIIAIFLFLAMPVHQMMNAAVPEAVEKARAEIRFNQKLAELRQILNEKSDKLSDPAVRQNILNLLRILVVLGAFTAVGYKAYAKTFGDRGAPKKIILAGPSMVPISVKEQEQAIVPPSYNASQFFMKIQSLSPNALTYLDTLIPALEEQFGSAPDITMNGVSLVSAAIDANKLSVINKAELIRWLKNYGVMPTPSDIQKANATEQQLIIDAVTD